MYTPIVISSCDLYRDAWTPFFWLFHRYWKDWPGTAYLVSNTSDYDDPRVTTIKVGVDRGWASNMKYVLSCFDSEYLIYMQEDYFLTRSVESQRIQCLIDLARKHRAACLRLYPSPGPDELYCYEPSVGKLAEDAPYRVSLQAAIWNREVLSSLLVDGETGWDMEIQGSERSRSLSTPFLSVTDLQYPAIAYLHRTAIVKGRWTDEAVELCRNEGIPLDTGKRPVGDLRNLVMSRQTPLTRLRRYVGRFKSPR
jgi:hypothetical protein